MSARDRINRASRHMQPKAEDDEDDLGPIEVVSTPMARMEGQRHLDKAAEAGVYRKRQHHLRRGLSEIRARDLTRYGFDPAMPPEDQLLERLFVITRDQAFRLDDLFIAYKKPRTSFLRLVVEMGIKALSDRMPSSRGPSRTT